MTDDLSIDGSLEEQWLEQLAVKCQCCAHCWQVPCPGCIQGGLCDQMRCECDSERYGFIEDCYDDEDC